MNWRVVAVVACLVSQPAVAQEKTPASAFDFIRTNMTDGSWTGTFDECYPTGNCRTWGGNRITGVQYVGTYCKLRFSIQIRSRTVNYTVDLRNNFEVGENMSRVFFAGPIFDDSGKSMSNWEALAPSYEIAVRVSKAVLFIQEGCKPKSVW